MLLDASPDRLTWHRLCGSLLRRHRSLRPAASASATARASTPPSVERRARRSAAHAGRRREPVRVRDPRRGHQARCASSVTTSARPRSPRAAPSSSRAALPPHAHARRAARRPRSFAAAALPRARSGCARVRLDRDEIFVDALEAAIEGIELQRYVRLALDGRLGGRVVAHLLASATLAEPRPRDPAALSRSGPPCPSISAAQRTRSGIRTDGLAILEGLLVENRVGDAMKSVLDDIFGALRPRRTRHPPPRR